MTKLTRLGLRQLIKEELTQLVTEDRWSFLRSSIPDEIHSEVETAFSESVEMYQEHDAYYIAGALDPYGTDLMDKIVKTIEGFSAGDVDQLKLGVALLIDKAKQ